MILEAPAPEQVGRHGEMKVRNVGIGDPGIMMMHMFDSIYTNKIKVILQELASNARDAHREIGIPDEPIMINFPSSYDRVFSVTDHGPGLNPTRIDEIYNQIGNSTKRKSNTQVGGFGIGSKTPWAKVNMFLVKTTAWEGDVLMYREYAMTRSGIHFSNSEIGDPVVMDGAVERTGTTVEMELEEKDWPQLEEEIRNIFHVWNPKPIIQSKVIEWKKPYDVLFSGRGWAINTNDYGIDNVIYLADIPYPINKKILLDQLAGLITNIELPDGTIVNQQSSDLAHKINRIESQIELFFKLNSCLFFNTGELAPALNRESFQYIDDTSRRIISRMCAASQTVLKTYKEKIQEKSTFIEALKYWKELHNTIFSNTNMVERFKWKGHQLNTNMRINLPESVHCTVYSSSRHGNKKIHRNSHDFINVYGDTAQILINDGSMNELDLKHYLLTTGSEVQVISFTNYYNSNNNIGFTADEVKQKFLDSDIIVGIQFGINTSALPKRPKAIRFSALAGIKRDPLKVSSWNGKRLTDLF